MTLDLTLTLEARHKKLENEHELQAFYTNHSSYAKLQIVLFLIHCEVIPLMPNYVFFYSEITYI